MSPEEIKAKYRELVESIRECMLVTDDPQIGPRARPMYLSEIDAEGHLWFFANLKSDKIDEIYHEATVCCAFAKPSDKSYVSATGPARVITDRARKEQLYGKMNDAWFDGPEDPNAALICVAVEHAEVWDDNDSSVVTMAKIMASAVTGTNYQDTTNEKLNLR